MKLKKITSWLFRDNLELHKRWWHRLIKVLFLIPFFLIATGSYIAGLYDPEEMFLREHNIKVHNSLYSFTENFDTDGYINTIPYFFKQKGDFGYLVNGKVSYISLYSLGESLCVKDPESYLSEISIEMHPYYLKYLPYEERRYFTHADAEKEVRENFQSDTTRKCYLFDKENTYDEELAKATSKEIVNYSPNAFFYIEYTLIVALISLISFIIFGLIYYRVVLYVVFGSKK